jgi:hypothetical protein
VRATGSQSTRPSGRELDGDMDRRLTGNRGRCGGFVLISPAFMIRMNPYYEYLFSI